MKEDKHPGFSNVADKISAKEDVPKEAARAMLAARTRKTSPAAKKANPNLTKVKMPKAKESYGY